MENLIDLSEPIVTKKSVSNGPHKKSESRKFCGSQSLVFPPQKAISDSKNLKTKEIGEKAS